MRNTPSRHLPVREQRSVTVVRALPYDCGVVELGFVYQGTYFFYFSHNGAFFLLDSSKGVALGTVPIWAGSQRGRLSG